MSLQSSIGLESLWNYLKTVTGFLLMFCYLHFIINKSDLVHHREHSFYQGQNWNFSRELYIGLKYFLLIVSEPYFHGGGRWEMDRRVRNILLRRFIYLFNPCKIRDRSMHINTLNTRYGVEFLDNFHPWLKNMSSKFWVDSA